MRTPKAAVVDADEQVARQIAKWSLDPLQFVMDVFGPGYKELHGEELDPDVWQREFLEAVGRAANERDAPKMLALIACKGPGKSCGEAWVAWWFLYCFFDAEIVCTSITGDNLKANLWKELGLWYSMAPLLERTFEKFAEAIRHRERPDTWWCFARSFPQDADKTQQANTLAGLHSKNVMYIGDEAGDYPDGVVAAARGIFASKANVAILILGGNPTRTAGPLFAAAQNTFGLWWVKRITGDPDDPSRSRRIPIAWARAMIAEHGREHPWVMINVLGEFPTTQADKFLGPDDVARAQRRNPQQRDFEHEPVIIGIDTADGGADSTALCRRQGCVAFQLRTWRINDPMLLADQIAGVLIKLDPPPDAIFIDLGGPSGHGVQSRLKQLGFKAIGIDFGGAPVGDDPMAPQFANRRAEMAYKASKWVQKEGSLPADDQLALEITEPVFWVREKNKKSVVMVEPKDEIKKRIGRSPDKGDAFWLTWAAPVLPRGLAAARKTLVMEQQKVNPFDVLGGRTTR